MRPRNFHLLLAFATLVGSCATAPSKPEVVPFPHIGAGSQKQPTTLTTYADALTTVLRVMERELGFPPMDGELRMYNDRTSLEAGLIAEGYERSYAHEIASSLDGISRPGLIFANGAVLQWEHWAQRIVFLAHELTHVAEYALADGRRGTSEQWLREGFAEWVAWRVAGSLNMGSFTARKMTAVAGLQQARMKHELLPFSELRVQGSWVRAANRKVTTSMYLQAFVAVDFLIERHGVPSVLEYFRLFALSNDQLANFRAAFHEEPSAFAAAFEERLSRLLG